MKEHELETYPFSAINKNNNINYLAGIIQTSLSGQKAFDVFEETCKYSCDLRDLINQMKE